MNDSQDDSPGKNSKYGEMATEVGKILAESNDKTVMQKMYAAIQPRAYEAMHREMTIQLLSGSPFSFRFVYLVFNPSLFLPYLFRIRKVATVTRGK
ncbi:MAG: hypothetical protein WCT19_03580 [Candidatus Paceibacterota bacterium]|jgi:hypothetical protein